MRAAKQEEKSTGTQHPIGHHQGYTRDTEHMGGAATFPQATIFHSYAPTTPANMSSETPMPDTSQYQYYQQQVSKDNITIMDTSLPIFITFYSREYIILNLELYLFMFNSKV